MVIFQMELRTFLFLDTVGLAHFDLQRIVRGAPEFRHLGIDAQGQSVQRSCDYLCQYARTFMKKQGEPVATKAKSGGIQWVNYKLSQAEKDAFRAWDAPEDEISVALAQMALAGYRFSVSLDKYNKAIQASVICEIENSPNYGKGFSSYAHDWKSLWAMTIFKHFSLWAEKWPESSPRPEVEDFG